MTDGHPSYVQARAISAALIGPVVTTITLALLVLAIGQFSPACNMVDPCIPRQHDRRRSPGHG